MVTLKTRLAVFLVFLLVAGIAPVLALFHEHGQRAGWFIHSGPHIFFFACFVAPIAVAVFSGPLTQLARSCIPVARVGLLLLAMAVAGAACWFDYVDGLPQLFEFERSVQDDAKYKLSSVGEKTQGQEQAKPTLWEFYADPQKYSGTDPTLKDSYTRAMRKLASDGRRSLAVVVPYYVSMYVQIVFAVLYLFALGLAIWHPATRSDDIVDQLFTSGIFCLPWLPAEQAFLQTKSMLYAGQDATSIILGMGVVVLLVYGILYVLMSEGGRRVALPQITFGGLILLVTAIPEVSGGAWRLFSRDSHPAWSAMLFAFVMLFFITRLPVVRVVSPPAQQSDVDKEGTRKPEPPVSNATATPSAPAKKRQRRKRR